jgi:hypothetical protein
VLIRSATKPLSRSKRIDDGEMWCRRSSEIKVNGTLRRKSLVLEACNSWLSGFVLLLLYVAIRRIQILALVLVEGKETMGYGKRVNRVP